MSGGEGDAGGAVDMVAANGAGDGGAERSFPELVARIAAVPGRGHPRSEDA